MAEIIKISDHKPHLAGAIKCGFCSHEWTGICPINTEGNVPCLECPECGLMQGFYINPISPVEGENVYTCKCSGDVFYISDKGARCIRCGLLHEREDIYGDTEI